MVDKTRYSLKELCLGSHHFYVVFNPLFNGEKREHKTQAHEFYQTFKSKVKKSRDAHMYWGKIQIAHFSQPLVFENYKRVLEQNKAEGKDTYLFVSDYKHLWVGKVSDVLSEIKDPENALSFYAGKSVEIWFKLTDFNLISCQPSATLEKLQLLSVENEFYPYKIKEISPITAGIRFPMIIEDRGQNDYFSSADGKQILKKNQMIEDVDTSKDFADFLQSFVMPFSSFKKLPETLRLKIYNAEIMLLESQSAEKGDRKKLERSIMTYLMCLEMLLNETVISHIRLVEGHRVFVENGDHPKMVRAIPENSETQFIPLNDYHDVFNLGQIKKLMDNSTYFEHTTMEHIFSGKKAFWDYCKNELRLTLKNEGLIELRNQLMNGSQVKAHDRELLLIRNLLLGVGGQGILNEIIENYTQEQTKRKIA